MKKKVVLFVIFILSMTLASCVITESASVEWSGLEDQTVVRGDLIDLLEGVTATHSEDGDLTSSIIIKDDGDFSTHLAGGYTVTYEVTDASGAVFEKEKNFVVSIGHNVANGDFSLAAYGWTLDTPGGNATVAYNENGATVTINNAGTSWWGIQLKQENLLFKENITYKATVVASSPDGRSMSFGFEDPNDGYKMLTTDRNGFQAVALTSTPQTYEVYFTATANYSNIKAVLYLGNQLETDMVGDAPHTVLIESIEIEAVSKNANVTFTGIENIELTSGSTPMDPLQGVTASQGTLKVIGDLPTNVLVQSTYVITYVVELEDGSVAFATRLFEYKLAKDFEYQAINGDFSDGFVGWTQDVIQTQGSGAATFTDNEDGTVSVTVTNVSDAAWHIQLQQANSDFKAGESYVARVVIKASEARKIQLEIIQPGVWEPIAETVTLEVTTEYQTFEVHFTSEKDREGAKIGLLLGNVDALQPNNVTFTVDELQVYKYAPFNSELTDTNEPWVLDNIQAEMNEEGYLEVTFVDGQLGDFPWNHQLYQNQGFELVAGHTYQVEVRFKSSVARTLRAWIEDANNGFSGIATDAKTEINVLADTWTVLTYQVTITEDNDTTNAKFVIMLGGNFGDGTLAGVAHVVTVDYFRVTDITNQG
jgi:hypothetical protein